MGQAEGYFWTGMGPKSTQTAAVGPLPRGVPAGFGTFSLGRRVVKTDNRHLIKAPLLRQNRLMIGADRILRDGARQ
jgi:hypothetical protein